MGLSRANMSLASTHLVLCQRLAPLLAHNLAPRNSTCAARAEHFRHFRLSKSPELFKLGQSANLAVQPVPRRTRFVAEVQLLVAARRHLSDHPLDCRGRAVDLAQIPDLALATDIGDRHCVLLFRCVKPDKGFAILLHGPRSVHEARLGPPEQPSYLYCTSERAADLSPRT